MLSENVMLTLPWCVIHLSRLVLILKNKGGEGLLCQRRADWSSIKLNLISLFKGRAGGLRGEQMEWLNVCSERCHGSLISRAPNPSRRDNSSFGNPADRRLRSSRHAYVSMYVCWSGAEKLKIETYIELVQLHFFSLSSYRYRSDIFHNLLVSSCASFLLRRLKCKICCLH